MVTGSYVISDSHNHQAPVKTESPSPNLLPASSSLQPHYQLSFPSQYHSSHLSSQPPSQPSILRFGVLTSFNPPMDFNRQWQTVGSSQSSSGSGSVPKYDNNLDNAMSFSDDYDGMSDLLEIGHGNAGFTRTSESNSVTGEKIVRRRSSKACDQCRKSKCKCERSSPNEPCRSCILLGTSCTFLGPSRKRGPPKGYIDAIETRLHQTEALLGIVLACADERAETLIRDLSQDPLAREIINRVDHSPYGVKGRHGGNEGERASGKSRYAVAAAAEAKDGDSAKAELTSTHPSNEWQDRVTAMLRSINQSPKQNAPNGSEDHFLPPRKASATRSSMSQEARLSDELPAILTTASSERNGDGSVSPGRRQRRKVSESNDGSRDDYPSEKPGYQSVSAPVSTVSTPVVTASSSQWPSSASSTDSSPGRPPKGFLGSKSSRPVSSTLSPVSRDSQSVGSSAGITDITPTARRPLPNVLSEESCSPDSDDEQLTGAVGQLSLNEEEQVRYHGKVSGLHLLGSRDRTDHINEGGIWRFPKARVWPISRSVSEDDEGMSYLPPPEVHEHLLDVYFKCVHPSFPVIHKRIFYDALHSGPPTLHSDSPPQSQTSDSDSRSTRSSSSPPYNRRLRRVPALLLFAMFSIAARYSNHRSIPPKPVSLDSSTNTPQMWAAGDDYLEQASRILDKVYPNSRPSTCLALLLMGYREVGMGSMAQAWTYIGMAIRMAQDLGMHRSADRWERVGLGGRLFGDHELQERRRIWYGCVIMDKYVSAYIGRPLMIFERDFDTTLPSVDDPEEMQEIRTDESTVPVPGRIISCFNSAAGVSGILSMIIQAVYAVRPVSSRHGEAVYLEGILAKWYHELPEHLQYQPLSFKHPAPLPHVLTLHLQYWCAVLLLHRPFIPISLRENPRYTANTRENGGASITKGRSYELSAGAANHITSIASLYMERYSLDCCPVFLCYYVFTAGVMHVTTLSAFSNDPQGRLGLQKCLDLLKAMEMVWPSATRALELLRGVKVDLETTGDLPDFASQTVRHKRPFEQANDMDEDLALQYPSSSPSMQQNADTINRHHQHSYDQHRHSYPNDLHHSTPTFYNYATSTNYSRWPSESQFDTIPYNGTVSTSVLPQIYSTGLVEDRMPAMGRPVTTASPHSASNDPRYPHEAWNDYSSFTHHTTISHHHSSSYPHHTSSSHSFHSEPPYNS